MQTPFTIPLQDGSRRLTRYFLSGQYLNVRVTGDKLSSHNPGRYAVRIHTRPRRNGGWGRLQQAFQTSGGGCRFGPAAPGEGGGEDPVRRRGSADYHRRLWIVAGKELTGAYRSCDQNHP